MTEDETGRFQTRMELGDITKNLKSCVILSHALYF